MSLAKPAAWKQLVDESENLQEAGKLKDAEQLLLHILQDEPTLESNRLAYVYNNLGSICHDERRFLDADRYYRRSIAEWEKAGESHRMALAITLNNLASLLWDTGKVAEAELVFLKSANIQLAEVATDHSTRANLFQNLGAVHSSQKRWREAESAYRHALVLFSQTPTDQRRTALTLVNLAIVCKRTHRDGEAVALFNRAREIWQPCLSAAESEPVFLLDLATALWNGQRITEAESVVVKALATVELRYGTSHPRTAQALSLYAGILRGTHRRAQAESMQRRADEINTASVQVGVARQTIDVGDLFNRLGTRP